ncbi:unnamed protein product [Enterobius vermicularis]|uniref:protein-serine/threonine phosphatase n=1 Tax=Enterobius vermicularis TaxID=51028 RepID=A0A0N4VC04_ENTVE|nr:unnamed protein product [Enterobius vermicularis]
MSLSAFVVTASSNRKNFGIRQRKETFNGKYEANVITHILYVAQSKRPPKMHEIEEVKTVVPLNLSMTEVEDAILKLMTSMPPQKRRIDKLISKEKLAKYNNVQGLTKTLRKVTTGNKKFVKNPEKNLDKLIVRAKTQAFCAEPFCIFLIFGTEVFRLGPTLVEFTVTDHCVVASDLHGSFDDLIVILRENGPPPEMQYLFLGDYVGRGKQQVDVFIMLLLLKLRWPRHIYMLRGTHECAERNIADTFFAAVSLEQQSVLFPNDVLARPPTADEYYKEILKV